MRKTNKNQSRIEKYQNLRNQVDEEIKILKLKKDNYEKIDLFRKKLDKIDNEIFKIAKKKAVNIFGNFDGLMNMARTSEKTELGELKRTLDEADNKIKDKLNEIEQKEPKVKNYVHQLGNESFIQNQMEEIEKNKEKIDEKFAEMLKQKESIREMVKNLNQNNKIDPNFFNQIIVTQNKLETRENSINYWKNIRKKKIQWVFWSSLVFLLLFVTCLIILIFVPNY